MGLSGLEPPTSRLSGVRSNRLSYKPVYLKALAFLSYKSGSHLLSHIVSNIVPSAAQVLTIVFGMRTGVTPERIATGSLSSLSLGRDPRSIPLGSADDLGPLSNLFFEKL